MNGIKIPSSNIYHILDLNATNKIKKVQISSNKFAVESGNVLKKEYIINYFSEKEDSKELDFVGGDPESNEFLFELEFFRPSEADNLNAQMVGVAMLGNGKNSLDLAIDKIVSVRTDTNKKVLNYTIKREQHYRMDSVGEDTIYKDRIITSGNLYYVSEGTTFSADIFNTYSSRTGVLAYLQQGVADAVYSYLLYEKITVEGIYYTPEEDIQEYGVSNATDFQMPSNELVQTANLIGQSSLISTLFQNITRKYANGKEIYELKCSISNYYDTNGDLAIFPFDDSYEDKLPATFKKHDIVEPWIYTSKGETPLSEKADGAPKRFEVIGIDFEDAGVVWQILTVQEYVE